MPIGSFGTPKTFRASQNTTCYVRLNTAFCRTANWVGKYFIVKATLSEYTLYRRVFQAQIQVENASKHPNLCTILTNKPNIKVDMRAKFQNST
ncbi:MAG: hypothetical protein IJE43_15515 [Alphaproteobacteria bacterium]|nr:hypothetical protein [Alphaproteobacteria bacterium]